MASLLNNKKPFVEFLLKDFLTIAKLNWCDILIKRMLKSDPRYERKVQSILILLSLGEFLGSTFACLSSQFFFVVFHWSLKDNKSPQVSMTLLSILADPNTAVVWMVSLLSLIFSSPRIFPRSFGDRSKFTNYNRYHCHFHISHHQLYVKVQEFVYFFAYFHFHSMTRWNSKIKITSSFLLLN